MEYLNHCGFKVIENSLDVYWPCLCVKPMRSSNTLMSCGSDSNQYNLEEVGVLTRFVVI